MTTEFAVGPTGVLVGVEVEVFVGVAGTIVITGGTVPVAVGVEVGVDVDPGGTVAVAVGTVPVAVGVGVGPVIVATSIDDIGTAPVAPPKAYSFPAD